MSGPRKRERYMRKQHLTSSLLCSTVAAAMSRRKIVVLVGDGMGDYPVEELGGRTPLQAANIPHIRRLAAAGEVRMVQTVPRSGLPPGSDVANLSLLGYKPEDYYTGRAPIEAAGAGIPLAPNDVAFRCNLVTITNGRMDDYSAGHISSEEGHQLIAEVERALGRNGLHFHGGVGYRHLLIWSDGPADIRTQPPHDIAGMPVADHLPAGERQEEVRALMERSIELFRDHPVNRARVLAGQKPATQIWLWGQGRAARLPSYKELYDLTGAVITAVDLVRGLGRLLGLDAVAVPGATGFIDTNYEGKVQAALKVLEQHPFVFLHVEAPDECGHMGDARLKVQAIELFDHRVVGPVWRALEERGEPYRLLLCTDHRTPVSVRSHTREPVPMIKVDGPVGLSHPEAAFDEFLHGGRISGPIYEWMRELLART